MKSATTTATQVSRLNSLTRAGHPVTAISHTDAGVVISVRYTPYGHPQYGRTVDIFADGTETHRDFADIEWARVQGFAA